jgi:hypothetical protein
VRTPWLRSVVGGVLCLAIIGLTGGDAVRGQAPGQVVVSVGIVPFQDESGIGVPNFGAGAAQLVRQRLSSQHRDALAKALPAAGAGPATVEQMQALGKQHAVKYVVQGGVLPIEIGPSGDPTTITVSLYADVVAPDSGQTQTLRVDGSAAAPAKGLGIADPASADATSAAFAQTPVGQALADAAGKLADAIYQIVTSAAQMPEPAAPQAPADQAPAQQAPAGQPSAEPMAGDLTGAAAPQEADAELQQLIADAQNAIVGYGGAAPQLADQVRAGLEQLNTALAQKADQLSRGEDTQTTDQSIAQIKESVRASVNALMQAQVNGQASLPSGQSGAPSESVMGRVNTFASDLLSLVQKVQELKALVGGAGQEAAAAAQPPPDASADSATGTQPVEQAPGSVTGVVVEDGQPVSGAEVTETSTGTTTTTGPDGSYTLSPLPHGLLGVLSVKDHGKLVAVGRIPVLGARASLADFQLRKGGLAATRLGVLSSTAMSRVVPAHAGILRGRVLDARGNPVALALVTVPGAGPVRTNALGEFLVPRVAAGPLSISVRHSTLGAVTSPVTITAGSAPTVAIMRLAPPPPGRMVAAVPPRLVALDRTGGLVRGHIRDQNDKDLPGVRVSLLRGGGTLSVLTGSAGRFALRDVSPGDYRVVIARPGFETAMRQIVLKPRGDEKIDLKLRQLTALVDTMRNIEATKHVVVTPAGRAPVAARPTPIPARDKPVIEPGILKPGGILLPRPGMRTAPRPAPGLVRGRVTDARTGRPLGGATVSVSGAGSAVTGGDGSYHIDGVMPGTMEVKVSRAGYLPQSRTVSVGAGATVGADFSLRAALQLMKR